VTTVTARDVTASDHPDLEPWEVFQQAKDGDPMRHGGNVLAPDRELAVHYARELFARRNESRRLWVVRRADIAVLDDQIETLLTPFAPAAERLDELPGIGPVAAAVIIAEIGLDMTRFPTAGHLCSWAKFSPGVKSSAGKTQGNGSTGHGNRYLARILGEAAVMAARSDTFLGERYRRIARRRGKKKAIVAVGRSMLVIIWHLLADPETHFNDLGADHFTRNVNTELKKRNHIRQLEALGYTVTLEPAA